MPHFWGAGAVGGLGVGEAGAVGAGTVGRGGRTSARRRWRIEIASDVPMNKTKQTIVTLFRSDMAARPLMMGEAPPPPPKILARSDPCPCWSKTAMMIKMHRKTCKVMMSPNTVRLSCRFIQS